MTEQQKAKNLTAATGVAAIVAAMSNRTEAFQGAVLACRDFEGSTKAYISAVELMMGAPVVMSPMANEYDAWAAACLLLTASEITYDEAIALSGYLLVRAGFSE